MFKQRSNQKELLDAEDIPTVDLYQNLNELDVINRLLGGYKISINALKKVIENFTFNKKIVLVDIGCGGGDTLKFFHRWNKKTENLPFQFVGIDLKQTCVDYARTHKPHPDIQFICDDYRNAHVHLPKIDILHACLFCHHLSEYQIVELIRYAQNNKICLVINDLERNPLAYFSIKYLTALFSNSYLVKNDACLSVLRGFKKTEWEAILQSANVKNYEINWKWAFRHQIIVYAP